MFGGGGALDSLQGAVAGPGVQRRGVTHPSGHNEGRHKTGMDPNGSEVNSLLSVLRRSWPSGVNNGCEY